MILIKTNLLHILIGSKFFKMNKKFIDKPDYIVFNLAFKKLLRKI